jgi:predicted PurR-regulated permease PerM
MKTAARELQVHTVCQMILAAVAVGAALYFLRSVLLPFILALFFVTGVAPVLHVIEKRLRAPRMVAVAIAFLLGIVLFTILWLLVWLSVASLLNNAENYRQRIAKLVVMAEDWLPDRLWPPGADGPRKVELPALPLEPETPPQETVPSSAEEEAAPSGTEKEPAATDAPVDGSVVPRDEKAANTPDGAELPDKHGPPDKDATPERDPEVAGGSPPDLPATTDALPGTREPAPPVAPAGTADAGLSEAKSPSTVSPASGTNGLLPAGDTPLVAPTRGPDGLLTDGLAPLSAAGKLPQPIAMPNAVGDKNIPRNGTSYDFSAFMSQHVGNIMTRLSAALMDLLSSALMVLIFMFFLLLGDSAKALPKSGVWAQIESGIRNYIVAKTMISIITGATFGCVLWFFGVPLALVFGLLAFFLNYIPNIGPIIASLLPLPLILLHPDMSVFSMVVVIALTSGIQFVSGNVVEPKIMGDSFELHPVVILLTLMFWGMLWGIVGMFLATPITAAIKIFLEQFEHTRPIARWLEGRFR